MMKLVLDTDVIVAAFRSPKGASAALLRMAARKEFAMAISVALLLEYESVMCRPEHLAAADQTMDDALTIIDAIADFAENVAIDYVWRPQTRDPADEMVLESAINGQADAIVTFNRRDFGLAPARFGIGCWLPAEALEKLR
jgi:putative PIN family toxin of toxin-antitoxin system